jgi:hypothetical protein
MLPKEAARNGKNKPAAEVPNVEENLHTKESAQVSDIEELIQQPEKGTQPTQTD